MKCVFNISDIEVYEQPQKTEKISFGKRQTTFPNNF